MSAVASTYQGDLESGRATESPKWNYELVVTGKKWWWQERVCRALNNSKTYEKRLVFLARCFLKVDSLKWKEKMSDKSSGCVWQVVP